MPKARSGPRRYSYAFHRLIFPAVRVLLGIRSSFSRDAAVLLPGIQPAPRILDVENIPPETPFVLVVNHYDRPGLGAWWGIAVIATSLAARRTREPRELHFAMAREWWYPSGIGRAIKQPLTHWLFGQLGKAYGLVLLPPNIGNDRFRGEGVSGIRRALHYTRGKNPELVGIAPEGMTGENLALAKPPQGAGLFLLMMTRDEIPCMPVGIYEDEDWRLNVKFGQPFGLRVPRSAPREEQDALAACQVMVEIGKLLPEKMWGVYREDIVGQKKTHEVSETSRV